MSPINQRSLLSRGEAHNLQSWLPPALQIRRVKASRSWQAGGLTPIRAEPLTTDPPASAERKTLNEGIAKFYDASTGLWESMWGRLGRWVGAPVTQQLAVGVGRGPQLFVLAHAGPNQLESMQSSPLRR